jgi:hypothetical protein
MWTAFRQLVKRAFCLRYKNTLIRSDVRLNNPLGGWYQVPRHIQYSEYRTKVKLFQRQDNGFRRLIEKDSSNYFIEDGECENLPMTAHPAESTKTVRQHTQVINQYELIPAAPPPNDATDDVDQEDPEHIHRATNIIAASDSSVDPITGEATYNWRITTYDKKGLITKSSFINANPLYMNSYRGEMAGIQDLVDYMHKTDLRRKVLKIVCDNKGCVDILQNNEVSLVDLDKAESDLIRDIKKKLTDFDDATIEWVKGHQDDDETYENLPIESQLNIDCDAAANLKERQKPTTKALPVAGSKATLYIGGHIVTTELNNQIPKSKSLSRKMLE